RTGTPLAKNRQRLLGLEVDVVGLGLAADGYRLQRRLARVRVLRRYARRRRGWQIRRGLAFPGQRRQSEQPRRRVRQRVAKADAVDADRRALLVLVGVDDVPAVLVSQGD